MASALVNAIPAQPTQGPSRGIINGFGSPASFLAAAYAAQESLGPVSQSFSDLAADLMKAPIAAAMMGGSDELSDQNSNWDMRPIPVPMRARAYPFCDWHRSFTKGAALFSSLKSTTAAADKHTLATIPMLNLFHEQRAYADARILADEEPEITRPQLAVVRALTARTPAEFAELWGYCGVAEEASSTNTSATEPLWSVDVGGAGRVEVANIFGPDVKEFDELSIVCRLETPVLEESAMPHAPQPINILRLRGRAVRGQAYRMTNREAFAPMPRVPPSEGDLYTAPKPGAPGDVDCIAHKWPIKPVWREFAYDPDAESWTTTERSLGALVASTFNMDLYTHGFVVRIGYVTDQRPVNAKQELIDAAHFDIASYQKLPNVAIAPFVRRR